MIADEDADIKIRINSFRTFVGRFTITGSVFSYCGIHQIFSLSCFSSLRRYGLFRLFPVIPPRRGFPFLCRLFIFAAHSLSVIHKPFHFPCHIIIIARRQIRPQSRGTHGMQKFEWFWDRLRWSAPSLEAHDMRLAARPARPRFPCVLASG